MNFSISLSDELSEKIILKAAENNITPTHYIEMLINSIIIDDPDAYFDYISAANIITEQAEALAKENSVGKTFPLNDLPYFKELNNTIDLNGRTAPSTVKARIGRNFPTVPRFMKLFLVSFLPAWYNTNAKCEDFEHE